MTVGFALLRPLIADALCIRGDEFLRSGDPTVAQHYYRLAIDSDPDCGTAVERFVFAALEIHAQPSLTVGIKVADAYLAKHDDDSVRIDRALALWIVRDFKRAADELRDVGAKTHDVRYLRLSRIAESRMRKGAD